MLEWEMGVTERHQAKMREAITGWSGAESEFIRLLCRVRAVCGLVPPAASVKGFRSAFFGERGCYGGALVDNCIKFCSTSKGVLSIASFQCRLESLAEAVIVAMVRSWVVSNRSKYLGPTKMGGHDHFLIFSGWHLDGSPRNSRWRLCRKYGIRFTTYRSRCKWL